MRNYITLVFDDQAKTYDALHALWELDRCADITVHGTAVVHRDSLGHFQVDTKETHPTLATAFGIGIGALLGLLAGPVGLAIGAAAGASFGAATGALVGVTADVMRADTRDTAESEAAAVIGRGQSAVIADVSEYWSAPVETINQRLGGSLYRRNKSKIRRDTWFDDGYLYPYEYVQPRDSSWAF